VHVLKKQMILVDKETFADGKHLLLLLVTRWVNVKRIHTYALASNPECVGRLSNGKNFSYELKVRVGTTREETWEGRESRACKVSWEPPRTMHSPCGLPPPPRV